MEELNEKDVKKISLYLKKHFGQDEPTPEEVLKLAKDSGSLLHCYFEWDDKKAAKSYRLIQAKTLIKVVIIDEMRDRAPTYKYLKLMPDEGASYFDQEDSPKESLYDHMVPCALSELRQFKYKYNNLPEFESVIQAILEVERKLENVSSSTVQEQEAV